MKLLQHLMELKGTSGNEATVRQFILKEIRKYVNNVHVDTFGNIVAHKKGKGPKVMLAAHIDEVGLMVKNINEHGQIYCAEIGQIDALSLLGQNVHIKGKHVVNGIVTTPEIADSEEIQKVPKIDDLIIDTGLTKKELKKNGIETGTFIDLEKPATVLAKTCIAGKALDDRIGCFIILELARKLKKSKADVYFVFTVQEEIGLYGSKTSTYSLENLDWAIAVDVTSADDSKSHMHETTKALGKGPCVTIKDADMIGNAKLVDMIKKAGKKKKIPLQLEVSDIGTTDALSISISKGGIPATAVGVAVRNLHTAFGVASFKDITSTVNLLAELLRSPPKKMF